MKDWIANLFEFPELTRMGHFQRVQDSNLGLGWIYYGLARAIRPKKVVVIGSYRGFVPLVLGKALVDNGDQGEVIFIDPSFVDNFWKDAERVKKYFENFGVTNIQHFLTTTQEFVQSTTYRSLESLGIVFVDGYHSEHQARFDYEAFERLLVPEGVVLFHDTANCDITKIYGPEQAYERRVKYFIDELRKEVNLQVFDLPLDQGVTLVRKCGATKHDSIAETAPCLAVKSSFSRHRAKMGNR